MKDPISGSDKRLIARANELQALRAISQYGHLRRSEIARAIWPASSVTVGEKMAHRTVRRLLASGQIREHPNSLGGRSLFLTARGVNLLRTYGVDARSSHEHSIAGPNFYHRTLGTRYCVERAALGHQSFGEYSILIGQAPTSQDRMRERFGKLPDAVIVTPGHERGYVPALHVADWIEVESSYKPERDLVRIFDVALSVGKYLDEADSIMLDRVLLVFDRTQHHEQRILTSLRRYLNQRSVTETVLSSIVLVRCEISLPLVWRGSAEIDCLKLLQARSSTGTPRLTSKTKPPSDSLP